MTREFHIKALLSIVLSYFMVSAFCQRSSHNDTSYDIVVLGATPGGIMASIEAARMGKQVLLIERTNHIGGLPANGLGATDIATRGATAGLFAEFVNRIASYYTATYGSSSPQAKACSDGFHFEPSVAEHVFKTMIDEHSQNITVLMQRQFNFSYGDLLMDGNSIRQLRVINLKTGKEEYYQGRVFIDATYEGDLGAAAKVPYYVGREPRWMFNEPGAGRAYDYWKSDPTPDGTGDGDNAIQAYNYRLCLTDDTSRMIKIQKPDNYRREDYVSLIDDVWSGRNTTKAMRGVTDSMMQANCRHIEQGGQTTLPGDVWGIYKLVTMNLLPNHKYDANNQHAVFLSTDLPEENWPWPTSSWEWRDRFAQRLKSYTLGLFWFAQHDEALPANFRKEVSRWGLSSTEYADNGGFPRQVYVREGRRFDGMYFFTAKDALPVIEGARPPLHSSSITASHYALDSHAARKREQGKAHLDGFISYPTAVYTVPYGVIVPKQVTNLLLPVAVSGSHIGFSTLRMEPCWMALGQAAGAAAALALDEKVSVQHVNIDSLQSRLLSEKAMLYYFKDVKPDDPDFQKVEYLGLHGLIPEWEARLDDHITTEELAAWQAKAACKLKAIAGKTKRRDVIRQMVLK